MDKGRGVDAGEGVDFGEGGCGTVGFVWLRMWGGGQGRGAYADRLRLELQSGGNLVGCEIVDGGRIQGGGSAEMRDVRRYVKYR